MRNPCGAHLLGLTGRVGGKHCLGKQGLGVCRAKCLGVSVWACEPWSRLSPCSLVLTGTEAKVFQAKPEMHWSKQARIETSQRLEGRPDGSEVKRVYCCLRGPSFSGQHPHGGSQTLYTPVPGNPISFPSCGSQTCMRCIYTHAQAHMHAQKENQIL